MQKTRVQSLGREARLEKKMATHCSFLPGESHGWRSLVGYSPWGHKESDTTERRNHHRPLNSKTPWEQVLKLFCWTQPRDSSSSSCPTLAPQEGESLRENPVYGLSIKVEYSGHLMRKLTYWKRPWCWERSKAGGEGDKRGWDGWMASLTRWTWVWASSRSWWWTWKPGVLQSMGSQRIGHNWATDLYWSAAFDVVGMENAHKAAAFFHVPFFFLLPV